MATHDGRDVHVSAQPAVHTPIDSDASVTFVVGPQKGPDSPYVANSMPARAKGRAVAAFVTWVSAAPCVCTQHTAPCLNRRKLQMLSLSLSC